MTRTWRRRWTTGAKAAVLAPLGRALGRLDRRRGHRRDDEPGGERARRRRRCPTARPCRAEAIEAPGQRLARARDERRVGRAGHRQRVDQRHPVGRAGGLPASRGDHQHRRRGVQPALAAGRRDRAGGVGPRPLRRQLPRRRGRRHARHRRATAQRGGQRPGDRATPTPVCSTATSASTARSARCSSSRRPGRSWASTPTTTGSATPRTSTTPRWRALSTSAPARTTCRPRPGQRASVFRYNHSETYVDLVLSIMNAYLTGDYTAVPNGTVAGGFLTPMVPSGGDGPGWRRRWRRRQARRPGRAGRRPRRPRLADSWHSCPDPDRHSGSDPDRRTDRRPQARADRLGEPDHPGDAAAEPDPAAAAAAHADPAAPDTHDHHRGRGDRAVPGQGPDRQPAGPRTTPSTSASPTCSTPS